MPGRGARPRRARAGSGAARRAVVLAMALVAEAGLARLAAQAGPAPAEGVPAARVIVDRHVEAIGGRAALVAHRSFRARGTYEVPAQGLSGDLEMLAAAPDRLLVRVSLPGIGDMTTGFDGRIGWAINPLTGPMRLDGTALEELRADARFHGALREGPEIARLETVGREDFDGAPAWKVRVVRASGAEDVEFYAVDSGLLIGSRATRESPLGPIEATTSFADYQRFGDVLVATRTTQRAAGVEQVMRIRTIEHDVVDPALFALPPAIQALVK